MTLRTNLLLTALLFAVAGLVVTPAAHADDAKSDVKKDNSKEAKKGPELKLASGRIKLQAPGEWEVKRPRTRIVQYEFAAPAAKGDKIPARITIMGAGGGVDANVNRWMGQFTQPDGKSTKERTKVDKKKLEGGELHVVDIKGTFLDKQGGPFAPGPTVKRPDYRMLGAIIVTPKLGQYFVKMYGPKATVDAQEKAFKKMVANAQIAGE